MSIRQRVYYNVCIFIFKIINGMIPQLNYKIGIVGGRTRQKEYIKKEHRKTKNAQKSLMYEGKMYNCTPDDVKSCKNLITFKRALREFVLTDIPIM